MKHRDVEFTVVQGVGGQLWKWSAWLGHFNLKGQAATKAEAVAEAERAIDLALAPKKLRLVRPAED
jgi:DNA segregation ATPase FtsK/SpoIIIE-like protein